VGLGRRAVFVGVVAVAVAACFFPAADLSEKTCPCAGDLVCDTARNRCVERLVEGGPGPDAGCPLGRGDCDGDPKNGCETDLATATGHCGFCGNVCPARANAFPACVAGKCDVGCNTGFDNCDGNKENGCEKPVSSDAANCGACKHDCQGSTCQNGLCDPIQLASDQRARCLLPTEADLYFGSETNAVIRLPAKAAGTPETIATSAGFAVGALCWLGTDGPHLYWSGYGNGALFRCNAPSCAGGSVTLRANAVRLGAVANATGFYVRTVGGVLHFDPAYDPDAGAPRSFSMPFGYGIAADGRTIFTGADLSPTSLNASVVALDTSADAGSDAGVVVRQELDQFAYGADALFVATSGGVFRCAKSGCADKPDLVTNKNGPPNFIATDGVHVYFTFDGNASNGFKDGAILRCPVAGCPPQGPLVLAKDQAQPSALATDDKALYWTSIDPAPATGGRVMKVAK
jgi:hypothetical protein